MEPGPDTSSIVNGLSVDVEDYYQVQSLEKAYTRPNWDSYPSRVEQNTRALLDIFAASKVKGTFFTLGWIAERYPAAARRH